MADLDYLKGLLGRARVPSTQLSVFIQTEYPGMDDVLVNAEVNLADQDNLKD